MKRDLATASAVFLASGAFGCLALVAFGRAGAPFVVVIMISAALAAVITMGQRVRMEIESRYRRSEALLSVYAAIEPKKPLPIPRSYMASPELLRVVATSVFERSPRTVLELGAGVSTLVAAYAIAKVGSGRIISLDHEQRFADATNELLRAHGLDAVAKVVWAPLVPVEAGEHKGRWYDLRALDGEAVSAVDLLIVDGPPGKDQPFARYPALPLLASRLSDQSCIIVDDAARPDETAMVERWLRQFPEFEAEVLPTEKGTTLLRRRAVR